MRRFDQQRFATLVSEFVSGSGIVPPFHMLVISSNGSIRVSKHTDTDVEEVCSFSRGPGMVSPVVVAVVAEDGRATSATKIEIGAARR
jgi:hypothetical protein